MDGKYNSLVWLTIAIVICIESLRLPIGSWQNPGAGFLPLGAGLFFGVLSIIDFLQSHQTKSNIRESGPSAQKLRRVALVLITLLTYAVILEFLGFLTSTFLLLFILFRAIEPQRWAVTLGASAAASLVTYVFFDLLLQGQLPKGIFGF